MEQQTFITLALITLFLPLTGFLILVFTGNRLPRKGDWLATGLVSAALIISLFLMITKLRLFPDEIMKASVDWIVLGDALYAGSFTIPLGIMIDNLTVIMLVVVTLISTLVHLFSIVYMKNDIRYARYFSYLGLFSFSMLGIVVTSNLLMMYMFWELVGISSYLLIGHWFEKKSATNAANKAFIINRIGDAGMFAGIMILFTGFATFGFDEIFAAIATGELPFGSEGWLTAAGLLIFCGAIGKSAQFPLHVWLPDAMEGPTPVSALIHAATMVAAGVYLVLRVFPLLTADALVVIAYIGAFTALIAATIAMTRYDIKKILAYSTISQLGFMIMAIGVGAFTAGFMHLVTHAAFKAGLFLGAGSVIYAMHNALHKRDDHSTDAQDIRNMGGLKSRMPFTYWTFVVFTLAIAGIPFTSGFLSKDEILAGVLAFSSLNGHYLLPLIAFAVAGMTAFYMFRMLILAFHGKHASATGLQDVKESPLLMTIPLIILASLSIFAIYSFNPFGASYGWFYAVIDRPLSVVPEMMRPASMEVFYAAVSKLHFSAMVLSIMIALLGVLMAFVIYQWRKLDAGRISDSLGFLFRGANNTWYFDQVYNRVFAGGTLQLTKALHWFDQHVVDGLVNGSATLTGVFSNISNWIDKYVVDGLVNLTAWLAGAGGNVLRKAQTGNVQSYVAFAIFGIVVIYIIISQINILNFPK